MGGEKEKSSWEGENESGRERDSERGNKENVRRAGPGKKKRGGKEKSFSSPPDVKLKEAWRKKVEERNGFGCMTARA